MPVWKPIARVQASLLAHPRSVLAGSLVSLAVAGALATGVEWRSSRAGLAPPEDPHQRRMNALLRDYRGSGSLIVCLEGEPGTSVTPLRMREAADALAASLASDARVGEVYHRIDRAWLLEHGLWLAPAHRIAEAIEAARARPELLAVVDEPAGIESINRSLARAVREGLREATAVADDERAPPALSWLARLLDAERGLLEDPEGVARRLAVGDVADLLPATLGNGLGDGYLTTDDGSALFLVVSARDRDDSLPVLREFVGAVRDDAEAVLADRPGLRVALTGQPAITVEEMDTVRRDTAITSTLALAGVSLLTLLVFRRKRHALLVLAALVVGLCWALGAVRVELGYLNMLTSSFLATLVGVGVAYGIHPVSEFELGAAGGGGRAAAVRDAYRRTGPGVTVAAATTAVAFLSILVMRFRGFAELGLVAGVGVVLCLASFMVVLPALLVLLGGRPRARRPLLDRLWDDRAAALVCRFPRTTSVTALVVTALAGWGLGGVRFNTDILDLLPTDSESLRYLRLMHERSRYSPIFNMVVSDDLEGLRSMRARAAVEPSIARFDSILHFLPQDLEASSAALASLRELLAGVQPATIAEPARRAGIVESLAGLEVALDDATEVAFTAGLADLVSGLERARAAAEAARQAAQDAPAGVEQHWDHAQQAALHAVHRLLEQLRVSAAAPAPTIDTVPGGLRERFVTASGRFVGLLLPAGSVFDPAELEPYVAASRRISPDAIGPPTMFWLMSGRITSGFYRALAVGASLVLLVLLLDFRNLRDTALAVVPLSMGVLWAIGGMRLLGLQLNFANMVGVLLIIGVGIDNGVHVVHRVRLEASAGIDVVLRRTGRAIVISSLTTMVGFGSLALAHHAGLASLGKMLLLGVGACLITSLAVLPNLMVWLGLARGVGRLE